MEFNTVADAITFLSLVKRSGRAESFDPPMEVIGRGEVQLT